MLFSVTGTFSRVKVRKPVSLTVMVYVPGWTVENRYVPFASVTASCEAPVSLCVIVTVAPGTAPPLLSVMLPTMEP